MTKLPADVTFTVGSSAYVPEQLKHTTESPGGYRECTFSLSGLQGAQIRIDDKLVIHNSTWDKYPFIGRISRIHRVGLCYDFTAVRSTRLQVMKSTTGPMGPAHPSGVYAGRIYKSGTLMLTALQDALGLCEDVFDGGILAVADQFVTDSVNMGGYTPEQIWNYVSSLLAILDSPLLWHIRGLSQLQVVVIDYADTSDRYITKLDEEQIDETYDAEQIITRAAIEYGNDQVYMEALPTVQAAGRQLIHDKYLNGSNDLSRISQAQALVGAHLARFGRFRSSGSTLTMNCDKDTIRVVPPLVTSPVDDWPLSLIESGHGIALLDREISHAPYNEGSKFIVGTTYDWDSGELVCTCGDSIGGLEGSIQEIVDYNVNRLFNGPYNGPPGGSHPLSDADLLNKVGSETGPLNSTSYAVPGFKDAQTTGDPNVPYDKQLDPDIVPDEGLEANINFDPATVGFQAAIRVTPGTFNQYRLLVGDTNGLVADTVVADLYRVIPTTESPAGGTQFMTTVQSFGIKDTGVRAIAPPVVLKRGDFYMIKVTTAGSSATWAALSLHAKKNFPALKS